MATTKMMESNQNFNYHEVVETEDEEDHLHPGPTPDNEDDSLSPVIQPSAHYCPRKKEHIVVPATQ